MWDKLRDWVRRWLGIQVPDEPSPDKCVSDYEDITGETITATIANKLAMLTFSDSTMNITDNQTEEPGARVKLISDVLDRLWCDDGVWITAQMLGKGGKVLVPTVVDGEIRINPIDQNRLMIREMRGRRITAATLLADSIVKNNVRYFLMADYELVGTAQVLRYRIINEDGGMAGAWSVPEWASITPEITIEGTDRLLFAFLRCPRDNRTDTKRFGVPITYGAERYIQELVEHMNIYRREFKLTRPMLALDSTLWRDGFNADPAGGLNIKAVKRTVQDGDDPFVPFNTSALDGSGIWQYYAPSIRQEAMENRLQSLFRITEKSIGLSQGILTERQSVNYANKDEVRAAQYDTYSVILAIRDQWEHAIEDLAYSIDVLAERFSITPAGSRGQYNVEFDWDTSMVESSSEAFQQNMELHTIGGLSTPELRQWVRGGTLEEAEKAVEEIRSTEKRDGISNMLRESDGDE